MLHNSCKQKTPNIYFNFEVDPLSIWSNIFKSSYCEVFSLNFNNAERHNLKCLIKFLKNTCVFVSPFIQNYAWRMNCNN